MPNDPHLSTTTSLSPSTTTSSQTTPQHHNAFHSPFLRTPNNSRTQNLPLRSLPALPAPSIPLPPPQCYLQTRLLARPPPPRREVPVPRPGQRRNHTDRLRRYGRPGQHTGTQHEHRRLFMGRLPSEQRGTGCGREGRVAGWWRGLQLVSLGRGGERSWECDEAGQ